MFSWTIKTELLVYILNDTFCSLNKMTTKTFLFLFKLELSIWNSNSKKDVSRLLNCTPNKFFFCFFVSLRVVGFFFVAQWHWTTRFVSYSGYTKIISLHFRSKTKMKTSALSGLGLHFWFWTKMSGYNFSEPLVAYKSGDSMPYWRLFSNLNMVIEWLVTCTENVNLDLFF